MIKMKKLLFFIFPVLFIYLLPGVLALNEGNPQYELVLVTKDTVINPGDNFNISVYIVGLGKIEKIIQLGVFSNKNFNLNDVYFFEESFGDHVKLYNNSILVELREDYVDRLFGEDYRPVGSKIGTLAETGATYYEQQVSPLLISLNSPKNIQGGDYQFDITLKYTDGESWYVSKEKTMVHVKSNFERKQVLVAILAVVLAIIAIDWDKKRLLTWSGLITSLLAAIILATYFDNNWLLSLFLVHLALAFIVNRIRKRKKSS